MRRIGWHYRLPTPTGDDIKINITLDRLTTNRISCNNAVLPPCEGGRWLARHSTTIKEDGPTSSLGHLSTGTEQCAVVILSVLNLMISFLNLKLWSRSVQSRAENQHRQGHQSRNHTCEQRGEGEGVGLASSAQHHQEDRPRLIAWMCEHGQRAVCGGVLVGDAGGVLLALRLRPRR